MDWLQVTLLAVVQGITEFLPISSSAHLILVPVLTGWPDQGLGFDLAVHVGTLAAVVSYFRAELAGMARDWVGSLRARSPVGDSRLAWAVLWGTVPVGLAALAFGDLVETTLRSPAVIIATTLGFALLLWWADVRARTAVGRSEHSLTWREVLVVGLAQAVALVPGTSRSGITMTAGLLMGLDRQGAARFSFLLAVPVTALAAGLKLLERAMGGAAVHWGAFVIGGLLSAATAFLVIHYFLALLTRFGMMPYVVYRLVLGWFWAGSWSWCSACRGGEPLSGRRGLGSRTGSVAPRGISATRGLPPPRPGRKASEPAFLKEFRGNRYISRS